MKKLLCLLILLMLTFSCFALAENEATWDFDAFDFSLDGYSGAGGDIIIPAVIQECTVDIIGLNAFNNMSGITSLTLPETVRQIEDGAIAFCNDLSAVTLSDGLLVIGDNCFSCNPSLTEVTLPASVCYVGSNAFSSCDNLRKIVFTGVCPVFADVAFDWLPADAVIYVPDDQYDAYSAAFAAMDLYLILQPSGVNATPVASSVIPEQFAIDAATGTLLYYEGYDVRVDVPAEIGGVPVKAIGDMAFMDRNYLCYLTLPEGVEVIGDSAFEGCTRLLHIDFPSTLKHIGNRAFANSLQAWHVDLPEGLESIGSEAFAYAAKLSGALHLPHSLKSIGHDAFAKTFWLEEVYIPSSVETIAENAFLDSGINYVVFEGLTLPELAANAFAECWNLADIDLNTKASKQQMLDLQGIVDALGLSCRVWRTQNPEVDYIYDGLDTYNGNVFTGYTGTQTHLRPYDIYDDVTITALADGAFQGNQSIEYFSVPYNDAFTTIGAEAFANSSLAKIDLFDSVTTIGSGAFRNCANLTELTLPESVTFVGEEALSGCVNLKKLIVLCDPAVLPENLLADCPADMEICAAENATDEQIAYLNALAGRNQTTLAVMPYEALPGADFWYDTDFARLDAYEGYALNLVLPREIDGVQLTMIGGGMMMRASSGDNYAQELPVVSVVIPETYTEIPAYAFQNCDTLETVICYAPIEVLNDCTFQNCTALREVIFVNGVGSIGSYVFDNCPSLQTVYLGHQVGSISDYAFMNEMGDTIWSLDQCITDPALLPDVDALLLAVQREPMAAPEPTPAPVAVPVGAEGTPFFGLWHGTEINMYGEVMRLSDLDMTMTLMLCEDGRMVFSESATIDMSLVSDGDWYAWRVENGVATADTSIMTLLEDGRLCVDEDGMLIYFTRDGQAAAADQHTEIKYICVNADVSGFTMEASMLGGEYSFVFHEGGSVDFIMVGNPLPGLTWTQLENGNFHVDMFGTPLEIIWTDAGFDMDYMGSMMMHFVPAV